MWEMRDTVDREDLQEVYQDEMQGWSLQTETEDYEETKMLGILVGQTNHPWKWCTCKADFHVNLLQQFLHSKSPF